MRKTKASAESLDAAFQDGRSATQARLLIVSVGEQFKKLLATKGLTKTAAAKSLEKTESYINSTCRGRNMTLRSLAMLASKLGAEVKIVIVPRP